MNNNEKLEHIKVLVNANTACYCSAHEACEVCDNRSEFNLLRRKIEGIIEGSLVKPRLDEVG